MKSTIAVLNYSYALLNRVRSPHPVHPENPDADKNRPRDALHDLHLFFLKGYLIASARRRSTTKRRIAEYRFFRAEFVLFCAFPSKAMYFLS